MTGDHPIYIIGAGPAGLTAAYALGRKGRRAIVLEADGQVGGIARTVEYKGFRFDIGGHRFFTKVRAVEDIWHDLLGPELLTRPRLSRIYFDGRFFDYPLKAWHAFKQLGPGKAAAIAASYGWAKLHPIRPEVSFEDWVVNRFGRELFETFFKPTPRRCGGCRARPSARSGQRSGSRGSRSGWQRARCWPRRSDGAAPRCAA